MSEKVEFKPKRVDWMDVEELACHILNINYDDVEHSDIDEAIYEKFECSMDTFQEIVEHLIPLADSGKSPITNELFQGFSVDEGEGVRRWIVKNKVN